MGNANNAQVRKTEKKENIYENTSVVQRADINYESNFYNVNDNLARIKNSLKFLYKNNFTSLTFVNFI